MPIHYSPERLDALMRRFESRLRASMQANPSRFTDADCANPSAVVDRVRDHLVMNGFRGILVRESITWPLVAEGLGLPATAKALQDYLKGY